MNLDPGAKTPPRQTRHGDRYAQAMRAILARQRRAEPEPVRASAEIDDLDRMLGSIDDEIAAGRVRVRFWRCPVDKHRGGELREEVRWIDGVAHCTWPGCTRTSEGQADALIKTSHNDPTGDPAAD